MVDTVKRGFSFSRKLDGSPSNGGQRARFLIDNGYNTALGKGDPVRVSGGYIVLATNGSVVTGIFDGCKYVDSNTGQTVEKDYWAAGTSSGGVLEGEIDAIGYIQIVNEDNIYICKADASVSAGMLGKTFPVSVSTPDSRFKRSTAKVHASVNSSADSYMVRVVGFPRIAGTGPDDAETVVEVQFINTGFAS